MVHLLLILVGLGAARAQDPEDAEDTPATDVRDEDEEDGEEDGGLTPEEMQAAEPAPLYTEGIQAEVAPALDAQRLEYLRPDRGRLPQEPYAWTPWSAYALEWGESRIGLSEVAIGLVPRVEVGTSLPLDALGVYNGRLKANAVRLGPVDLAVLASYHTLPRTDFSGSWLQAGGRLSVRIAQPVTWHVGALWGTLHASGLPDLGDAARFFTDDATELDAWTAQARAQGIELAVDRTTLSAETAIDWRFNRRDSLVLRAKATPWASGARTTEGILDEAPDDEVAESQETLDGLPPILALDRLLDSGDTTAERLASSYVTSLAYQAAFKNATLRIGFGLSAVRYAWLVQSTELTLHFGGKTRASERRMNKSWKRNKRDVEEGGEAPETAP